MNEVFEINGGNKPLKVKRIDVNGHPVYQITFYDGTRPLVLTQTIAAGGKSFWTSVPEGRQKIAEVVGELIDEHYRQNS